MRGQQNIKFTVPCLPQRQFIVAKASLDFPRHLSSNCQYTSERSTTVVITWALKWMHFILDWQFHCLRSWYVYLHVSISVPLLPPVLRYLNFTKKAHSYLYMPRIHTRNIDDIAQLMLNIDTRSRWVVSFRPCPLYLHVVNPEPSVYMGSETGWLQSRYRCFVKEKNISNLTGNRTPDSPGRGLFTIPRMTTSLGHLASAAGTGYL
jgi:hypothetical protein